MEIFILDEQFRSLYNIDTFESLIWTERYNGWGDFEFYTPVNKDILAIAETVQNKLDKKLDCYVWLRENESYMIIEDLDITTDVETGNHLIVSGRGLESILERRIIWEQTVINGNLQSGIQKLINDSIISPKISARKIPNFKFQTSQNEELKGLTLRAQYTGDVLYDTIYQICGTNDLGFDVYLDSDENFVFTLTKGENRSYDQEKNPYVIFSQKFENIINSDYLQSIRTLKNVTLVAGEDQGTDRRTRIVGSASGMTRRELYTDARDIQSETSEGTLTDEEYNAMLDQRGSEKLNNHPYTKIFTGEIEAIKTFVYGQDFFKGDIVQIVNEYNMESKVRVSEVVRVQDTSGLNMYPTFSVVE